MDRTSRCDLLPSPISSLLDSHKGSPKYSLPSKFVSDSQPHCVFRRSSIRFHLLSPRFPFNFGSLRPPVPLAPLSMCTTVTTLKKVQYLLATCAVTVCGVSWAQEGSVLPRRRFEKSVTPSHDARPDHPRSTSPYAACPQTEFWGLAFISVRPMHPAMRSAVLSLLGPPEPTGDPCA